MPKPDIHQLEESVLALLGEFRRLKEVNQGLSSQVDQLNREKEILANENSMNQGSQGRLCQLETLNKKSEKNRKAMRAKVQALIKKVDKFDLS
jgi:predicted RNase H-like nuclease (RuvC/YqgF family)